MPNAVDVFISYKREDEARVDQLAGLLGALGLKVWTDASLKGGEAWQARIDEIAQSAMVILVCWSAACASSRYVQREMDIARARGVMLMTWFSDGDLPDDVSALHCPDLRSWSGQSDHKGLRQLADGLSDKLDRPVASWLAERAHGQAPAAVAALRALLVDMARRKTPPISYDAAYDHVARHYVDGTRTSMRTLYGSLDSIADQCRANREPPLFGLVVNAHNNLPGRGYFQKHCYLPDEHHLLSAPLFAAQLERIYAYEWPRDA